jgi:hypothetical protein
MYIGTKIIALGLRGFPKNKFNKWVVGIAKHLRNIFEYLY